MIVVCLNEAEIPYRVKACVAIFTGILLFLSPDSQSQQNNNWYFARKAALDFNTSGTQPVPRVLSNSAMMADEGAAAMSDSNGHLLFYTNGVTVYNKKHEVMLNGSTLDGNISAAQIAIVPMPGNDSLYFIFTTDAIENNFTAGYKYSIVNMKRDGGNGEVISRNVLLHASCTERMATARHANGIDVWLITNDNNSNVFRAWLITCTGLQPGAVVSTVGDVLDQYRDINSGTIKFSPDGRLLCQTHFPYFDDLALPINYAQLFDFDNATGIISNPRSIRFPDVHYTHCEFSPDGKLLYLTRPLDKKIDQLKVDNPALAAIIASRTTFTTLRSVFDIESAPDEKIYFSQPGFNLGVISQPNVAGAGCSIKEDFLSVSPGNTFLGLPSHINDMTGFNDPRSGFTYRILDSCSGRVQFNAYTVLGGTIDWAWDFGDGNTSTAQNPVHTFTPSLAVYNIRLKITSTPGCGSVIRNARVKPSGVITSKPDFDFVVRCDSGYVRFINKTTGYEDLGPLLTWEFGDAGTSHDANPIHTYGGPGTYFVKLKVSTGIPCLDDEKSIPVDVKAFTVTAPPDQTILIGQSVFLNTDQPGSSYDWSPGVWLNDSTIRNPVATPLDDITYSIISRNAQGCIGEDSVHIHVLQYNDVYVPTGFSPNNDGKNDDIRPYIPGNYEMRGFRIFNRWGKLVFATSQRNKGWDGRINGMIQNSGVYVWALTLADKSGAIIEKKGSFMLIR